MLEQAGKAVRDCLQTYLGTYLDEVETYWSGEGDAITLPDVETWLFGHNPTVLDRPEADFPILTVWGQEEMPQAMTGGRRGVTPASDQPGFDEAHVVVLINWFIADDDEEDLNKMTSRYHEAIDKVLRANYRLDTGVWLERGLHVPETKLSPVARDRDDTSTETYFTQMGQKRIVVRVREP